MHPLLAISSTRDLHCEDAGFDRSPHLCQPCSSAAGFNLTESRRPFVEPNSVDHDDGVEGMTVARTHVLRPRRQYTGGVPGHVQAQIHKDKATCSILVRCLQFGL
jgi:Translocase of chloroplast 159/132, membrane anchor domain